MVRNVGLNKLDLWFQNFKKIKKKFFVEKLDFNYIQHTCPFVTSWKKNLLKREQKPWFQIQRRESNFLVGFFHISLPSALRSIPDSCGFQSVIEWKTPGGITRSKRLQPILWMYLATDPDGTCKKYWELGYFWPDIQKTRSQKKLSRKTGLVSWSTIFNLSFQTLIFLPNSFS